MTIDLFFIAFVLFQVVGESAPISSSGHLMLIKNLILSLGIEPTSLPNFFDDFLHGPMIMIIMIYFYRSWWSPIRMLLLVLQKIFTSGFRFAQLPDSHKNVLRLFFKISGMVVVADGATAVFYVLISKWLKHYSWFGNESMLLGGFVITMVVLLSSRRGAIPALVLRQAQDERGRANSRVLIKNNSNFFTRKQISTLEKNITITAHPEPVEGQERSITFPIALILGIIQGLAQLPGISRFGTTVVTARLLGISPRRSLQFSFLMFFPLITAAFFINGLPAVVTMAPGLLSPHTCMFYLLATIVSYFLFSVSCRFVLTNRFWWFGFYMIVPILVTVYKIIAP